MVWVVLGDAFFKTLALKQYFSSDDDAVKKNKNQMSTVQLSADVPVKVVAKLPPIDEKSFGQHFGLEQSSNLWP